MKRGSVNMTINIVEETIERNYREREPAILEF